MIYNTPLQKAKRKIGMALQNERDFVFNKKPVNVDTNKIRERVLKQQREALIKKRILEEQRRKNNRFSGIKNALRF